MKKIVKFLIRISEIINIIACKLQEITLREEFYVYVPSNSKPTYKHSTFNSARQEAERLSDIVTAGDDIEVLQVVYKTTGKDIPF